MSTLLVKRRNSGAAGAPSSLKSGEPAWSKPDQTLYIGSGDDGSGNATEIVAIAGKRDFASRTDLVSASLTLPEGTVVTAGGLTYRAQSGATDIADLAGFVPHGNVTPDHFALNATPGTTDMITAMQAAADYAQSIGVPLYLGAKTYAISAALEITGIATSGSFEGFAIIGAGREVSIIKQTTTTEHGIVVDNTDGTNAKPWMHGTLRDFSIEVSGAAKTDLCNGLYLKRCWNCSVTDITINGFTNHVVLEGAAQTKFARIYTSNSKRGAVESESVWTLTDSAYANSYGTEIINCEHQSAVMCERVFDLQAVDHLTVTGGHFNYYKKAIHIRPNNDGYQTSIFNPWFNGVHFDGGGGASTTDKVFIECTDPEGNGAGTTIRGLQFNGGYQRVGDYAFRFTTAGSGLDGLSEISDFSWDGVNIRDFGNIIFHLASSLAAPKDTVLRFSWNGLTFSDGSTPHTNNPNAWRLEGTGHVVNNCNVSGGWDSGGSDVIQVNAAADQITITNNQFDVSRTTAITINASATNVFSFGNTWPAGPTVELNKEELIAKDTPGSNGTYRQSYDGTLECWHTFTLTYSSAAVLTGTWTFPATFSAPPTLSMAYSSISLSAASESELGVVRANTVGTTSAAFRLPRISGMTGFVSGDTVTLHVRAIGEAA